MKKLAFYIVIAIIGLSCKPGIPKDVLQPKPMEDILFDMHIVDGYLNTLPTGDSVKKVASAYYNGVYKKYGIDSALFVRSKNYYYQRTDLFKDMYTRIVDRLNKERDNQTKISTTPAVKPDSTEKALKLKDSLVQKKADSIAKLKKDSIANKKRIDSIFKTKKIMKGKQDVQKPAIKPVN